MTCGLRLYVVFLPLPGSVIFLRFYDHRISAVKTAILQCVLICQLRKTLVGIVHVIVPQANFTVCRNVKKCLHDVLQLPYDSTAVMTL